jgi:trehalose 6-phosphate phosphatase
LCLDFDGTLAPIVTDPTMAALPDGLDAVLTRLGRGLGLLAIVSGRPATFLAERAGVPGVTLLGLYGLEEHRDGAVHPRPEAAAWQEKVDAAAATLAAAVGGLQGVWLERKGLAVGVHWRNAPDRQAAEAVVGHLVTEVAAATGLAREPGKFVEELRPPVEWDKGSAVRAAAEGRDLDLVVYAGDDRGDLAGFAAAQALGGLAVAVDHGAETAEEVLSSADVVLEGTEALAGLLRGLAEGLR